MENERFISGYCRTIDCSRMVTVETDGNKLLEVDCCYENCPYTGNCTVAEAIQGLLGEKE